MEEPAPVPRRVSPTEGPVTAAVTKALRVLTPFSYQPRRGRRHIRV
jgi:hypothetical protein